MGIVFVFVSLPVWRRRWAWGSMGARLGARAGKRRVGLEVEAKPGPGREGRKSLRRLGRGAVFAGLRPWAPASWLFACIARSWGKKRRIRVMRKEKRMKKEERGRGERRMGAERQRGGEAKRKKRIFARSVDIKKHYEIMAQLLLRLSYCASSKKSNPDLQWSPGSFSFGFFTPAQTTPTREGINTSCKLSQEKKRRRKKRIREGGSEARGGKKGARPGLALCRWVGLSAL